MFAFVKIFRVWFKMYSSYILFLFDHICSNILPTGDWNSAINACKNTPNWLPHIYTGDWILPEMHVKIPQIDYPICIHEIEIPPEMHVKIPQNDFPHIYTGDWNSARNACKNTPNRLPHIYTGDWNSARKGM